MQNKSQMNVHKPAVTAPARSSCLLLCPSAVLTRRLLPLARPHLFPVPLCIEMMLQGLCPDFTLCQFWASFHFACAGLCLALPRYHIQDQITSSGVLLWRSGKWCFNHCWCLNLSLGLPPKALMPDKYTVIQEINLTFLELGLSSFSFNRNSSEPVFIAEKAQRSSLNFLLGARSSALKPEGSAEGWGGGRSGGCSAGPLPAAASGPAVQPPPAPPSSLLQAGAAPASLPPPQSRSTGWFGCKLELQREFYCLPLLSGRICIMVLGLCALGYRQIHLVHEASLTARYPLCY